MSPHKQSNAGFPDFPFRLLGGSPEWIAGMRLHPGSVAATVSALTLCACVPYAGFPALVAAAVGCGAFYRSCEPLQLVLLPEQGAARFLARKVLAAWRNYFLFAVPYAAVIVLRHPDTCWMAAGWASLAALALLYAVVSKYARYQPDPPPAAGRQTGRRGIPHPPAAAAEPLPCGELRLEGRTQSQPLSP